MAGGGESARHRELKRLGLRWAQLEGWSICAEEVALPHSSYRADLAAYRPASERMREPDPRRPGRERLVTRAAVGLTAVFECKQARSDFLKDSRATAALRAKLERLAERRATLERTLRVHHPTLQSGDSLFPEFDQAALEDLGHRSLQQVLGQIRTLQGQLYAGVKFEELVRYRCASACWLVAEPEVFAPGEIPLGWGLLVRRGESLELRQRPALLDCHERTRLALLQRIAQTATRGANRAHGIDAASLWEERRGRRPATETPP
ncbi:MAG: hypothetical protein JSR82_02785 [Verrucomicrobia bacterium]|nr:hypothetical protein [Verrucomicrobiota bacterium]